MLDGSNSHIFNAIKHEELNCIEGGKYFHLTDNTDKVKAINVLKNLYCQMFKKIDPFGVGDGPNDLSMHKVVDRPFFIKKKVGVNSRFNAWTEILHFISTKLVV